MAHEHQPPTRSRVQNSPLAPPLLPACEMKSLIVFLSASAVALIAIALLPAFHSQRSLLLKVSSDAVADLVVTNGIIYTADSSLPFAEAMAIRSGRIIRVGNRSSVQVRSFAAVSVVVSWELVSHGTQELNVEGKVVLPGFVDSHVHFLSGGLQMTQVKLRIVKSQEEFVTKVTEAARGSWVLGGGWNNDQWGGDQPLASWIDSVTPNNPVWLSRMDGHMGLANSLALKIAGITNLTQDPPGGTIVRNSDGEPTGLLVDAAMKLLLPFIPNVSINERREALVRASKYAITRGVTTIIDLGRYFPGARAEQDLFKEMGRALSPWLYLGGVKAFADGSLGSNSALLYKKRDEKKKLLYETMTRQVIEPNRMLELQARRTRGDVNAYLGLMAAGSHTYGLSCVDALPTKPPARGQVYQTTKSAGAKGSKLSNKIHPYTDEPDNYGLQVTDSNWLLNTMLASDREGLQVAVHAIGDKANDLILDLYDSVASSNGLKDRRFRIEHAQHLAQGAACRFGQQAVIASVQPDHLLDDADSAAKKLGVARSLAESYLFQTLLSSNAHVAFGSDWPVADINPLGAIRTAMKRVPPGWGSAWIPSECFALNDALNAHTISAAYASFLDNDVGSLSAGKLADFVVLPVDSWEDLVEEIPASVLATYVGGEQFLQNVWLDSGDCQNHGPPQPLPLLLLLQRLNNGWFGCSWTDIFQYAFYSSRH
ncbi:hypothetical protein ACLOJK_024696 [Asimina triloba]